MRTRDQMDLEVLVVQEDQVLGDQVLVDQDSQADPAVQDFPSEVKVCLSEVRVVLEDQEVPVVLEDLPLGEECLHGRDQEVRLVPWDLVVQEVHLPPGWINLNVRGLNTMLQMGRNITITVRLRRVFGRNLKNLKISR